MNQQQEEQPLSELQPEEEEPAVVSPGEFMEEEFQEKVYYPLAPISFLSGSTAKLPYKREVEMHWCHYAWLLLFAFLYVQTLAYTQTDKVLMSAEVQNVFAQMFTDQSFNAERWTKGEIANDWAEQMNGDGVSKLLNWIQAFCMWKSGSDEHVPFGWTCNFRSINIGPTHPVAWDFQNNAPPGPGFSNVSDPNSGQSFVSAMCSPKFINAHIIRGDDSEVVPFGDLEAFRLLVRKEMADKGIVVDQHFMFDPTYDEWAALDGNPTINIFRRALEQSIQKEAPKIAKKFQTASLVERKAREEKLGARQRSAQEMIAAGEALRLAKKEAQSRSQQPGEEERRQSKARRTQERVGGRRNSRDSSALESGSSVPERVSLQEQPTLPEAAVQELKRATKNALEESLFEVFLSPRSRVPNVTNKDQPNVTDKDRANDTATAASDVDATAGAGLLKDYADITKEPRVRKAIQKVVREEQQAKEPDDELTHAGLGGDRPSWCYRSTGAVFTFADKLDQLGFRHHTKKLGEHEVRALLKEVDIHQVSEQNEMMRGILQSGGGKYTLEGLLLFVQNHRSMFREKKTSTVLTTCNNHHWGMVHMCGPEFIEVKIDFESAHVDPDPHGLSVGEKFEVHVRDQLELTLRFDQIGFDTSNPQDDGATGWYRATINADVYEPFGVKGWKHFIWAFLVVLLFIPLYLIDTVYTIFLLPHSLYQVLAPSERVKVTSVQEARSRLLSLIDGRSVRRLFMSTSQVLLEHMFALTFLCAMGDSIQQTFDPAVRSPTGRWPSGDCQQAFEEMAVVDGLWVMPQLKAWEYCMPPHSNPAAELIYIMVFQSNLIHALGSLFMCMRLMDIFNAFDGTAWLPLTIDLALRKLMYWFVFYFFTVCAFAGILSVAYGSAFRQFQRFSRTIIVLILYSCGFTEYAFDGVHTFEDSNSFYVTVIILLFSIMVVCIAMQFFTTIILDTYARLSEQETFLDACKEECDGFTRTISFLLFPNVPEGQESSKNGEHEDEFSLASYKALAPSDDAETEDLLRGEMGSY